VSAAKALLAVLATTLVVTAALFSATTTVSAATSVDLEMRAARLASACSDAQANVDRLVKCRRAKHRAVVLRKMVAREDRSALRLTKAVLKLNRDVLKTTDVDASTYDAVLGLNRKVLRLDSTALRLSEETLPGYPTRLTGKIDKAARTVRGLDKNVQNDSSDTWSVLPVTPEVEPDEPASPDSDPVSADSASTVLLPSPLLNVKDYGAKGDGVSDDYAAIQAAIAACGTAGGTIYFPAGTYYLNKPSAGGLKLPASNNSWLVFYGYDATVRLSSNVPRFLDFNRTTNHQTFQYFDVRGFDFDCGNVGGYQQIVIGAYGGVSHTRINIKHIRVRDCRSYNLPCSAANNRVGIHLSCYHSVDNEATVNYLEDIRVDNYRQEGGNNAVYVCGEIGDHGTPAVSSIHCDEIHISRVHFDALVDYSKCRLASPIQIGGRARGGTATVSDCYVRGSYDNCYEADSFDSMTYTNCVAEESKNLGFYYRNQAIPLSYPDTPTVTYKDCEYRQGTGTARGFACGYAGSYTLGDMTYEGCGMVDHRATSISSPWLYFGSTQFPVIESLTLKDCYVERTNHVTSSVAARSYPFINIRGGGTAAGGKTLLIIDSCDFSFASRYINPGGGSYIAYGVIVNGEFKLDICDGTTIAMHGTTIPSGGFRLMYLGNSVSELSGAIENCVFDTSGVVSPWGVYVASTSTLAIDPSLAIRNNDFSGMNPTAASNVIRVDASQTDYVDASGNTRPPTL
jgi:hypothetical protein